MKDHKLLNYKYSWQMYYFKLLSVNHLKEGFQFSRSVVSDSL